LIGFYRAANRRDRKRRAHALMDVGMSVWDGKGAHDLVKELSKD